MAKFAIPRLRMFAGPNGSGKSTLKDHLPANVWLGVYVNPDEIEKTLKAQSRLNLADFKISSDTSQVRDFFCRSSLLGAEKAAHIAQHLICKGNWLYCDNIQIDSYLASVLSDFLRQQLMQQKISFSFETVMSSPDKVDFLQRAQLAGFHTYLYFITTADVEINVARVANRVRLGGHPVPEDKIRARYQRSLKLLLNALRYCNRAYIFDNSGSAPVLLADIADGSVTARTTLLPAWFVEAVWSKLE